MTSARVRVVVAADQTVHNAWRSDAGTEGDGYCVYFVQCALYVLVIVRALTGWHQQCVCVSPSPPVKPCNKAVTSTAQSSQVSQ